MLSFAQSAAAVTMTAATGRHQPLVQGRPTCRGASPYGVTPEPRACRQTDFLGISRFQPDYEADTTAYLHDATCGGIVNSIRLLQGCKSNKTQDLRHGGTVIAAAMSRVFFVVVAL